MKNLKEISPGLIVAIVLGVLSMFLAKFIPKLGAATIAIFLGLVVGNLFLTQDIFKKGYKFAESDLLSCSIVLLGGTLSISTLLKLGIGGLLYIVIQMTITIVTCLFYGKKLGFSKDFSYLMASGNAVCGSSAISATSEVIDANDSDKGICVTIVNILGIVLMFLLPLIARYIYSLEETKTSALIGGILQSVGQVVASASMVSTEVKELAMIFKIFRIILLLVVVFIFGYLRRKDTEGIIEEEVAAVGSGRVNVPWYVIGFFITCAFFSLKMIPMNISLILKSVSNKLEIIALAGIGLRVRIKELLQQGKAISIYAVLIGVTQIISGVILIYFLIK